MSYEQGIEKATRHLAWLMWCYVQGYMDPEDRRIMKNWMEEDPLTVGDMKERDGLMQIASEALAEAIEAFLSAQPTIPTNSVEDEDHGLLPVLYVKEPGLYWVVRIVERETP